MDCIRRNRFPTRQTRINRSRGQRTWKGSGYAAQGGTRPVKRRSLVTADSIRTAAQEYWTISSRIRTDHLHPTGPHLSKLLLCLACSNAAAAPGFPRAISASATLTCRSLGLYVIKVRMRSITYAEVHIKRRRRKQRHADSSEQGLRRRRS